MVQYGLLGRSLIIAAAGTKLHPISSKLEDPVWNSQDSKTQSAPRLKTRRLSLRRDSRLEDARLLTRDRDRTCYQYRTRCMNSSWLNKRTNLDEILELALWRETGRRSSLSVRHYISLYQGTRRHRRAEGLRAQVVCGVVLTAESVSDTAWRRGRRRRGRSAHRGRQFSQGSIARGSTLIIFVSRLAILGELGSWVSLKARHTWTDGCTQVAGE